MWGGVLFFFFFNHAGRNILSAFGLRNSGENSSVILCSNGKLKSEVVFLAFIISFLLLAQTFFSNSDRLN